MSRPKKTVLIVEDGPDLRVIYSTLIRQIGYQVLEARDGEEGLRMARERTPDLVVTDIQLPSISGITLLHRLKGNRTTSGIPIVAISSDTNNREQVHNAGCEVFLPKPVDLMTLAECIDKCVA